MKNSKKYLFAGIAMIIIAIAFINFALKHPEMSFPWSLGITYAIYISYMILTIFLIVKGIKKDN